jgi:hypothetical protein
VLKPASCPESTGRPDQSELGDGRGNRIALDLIDYDDLVGARTATRQRLQVVRSWLGRPIVGMITDTSRIRDSLALKPNLIS